MVDEKPEQAPAAVDPDAQPAVRADQKPKLKVGKGQVRVRRWTGADIAKLIECQKLAYSDYSDEGMYDARRYELQLAAFPEGQYLAEVDGEVVGYATSLIVQLDHMPHVYEYDELTGSGTFSTHTPGGDTLYGADIAVVPAWRGKGVAGKLYTARKRLLRRHNLRRMLAYGRLTRYGQHAGKLTAREYVDKVVQGELKDPALSAHLKAGYRVMQVSMNIMHDATSLDYATLLEYENPVYDPHKRRIAASPVRRTSRQARICASQYLMRNIRRWSEFEQSVRFFADAADEYHSHFLVLPEYFTAVLFNLAPKGLDHKAAFRWVSEQRSRYVDFLTELAKDYDLYIIGGTIPTERNGSLYNVAHFFTPSGAVYTQDKLHITPTERDLWGVRPGEKLRVFETPYARVAILVCYDIEFPELARLLTLAGVELIFVPFSTDDKKAYNRVRVCAAARAIENSIYVVMSGNTGNLAKRSYLLNYSRSAILTPSDVSFPDGAVAGEADANIETVVVADLDFVTLAQHRLDGSVRPLHERRPDLYELRSKINVELIHTE